MEGYDFLRPLSTKDPTPTAKSNCTLAVDLGLTRLRAGDSLSISIQVDTAGFPAGSTYRCLNCEALNGGTLTTTPNGFLYRSNPEVEEQLDTLLLAYCEPNGERCSAGLTRRILVQRAARTITLAEQSLFPEEVRNVSVPADLLPGGVACRRFLDCPDGYTGRDQTAIFLFGLGGGNDFEYTAGRQAGTDLVCLELCNPRGLCDTYTFPFRVVRENLSLPFFDDFSYPGFQPALRLWQDRDVLVNRSYGVEPPSIGVATFDGVGPSGMPYPAGSNLTTPRDYLTSAGLNLSGVLGSTLTFYAQPRGVGNRPETQDSLVLQFRQPNGRWRRVWSSTGLSSGESNCSDRPFIGHRVPISQDYAYNGFQFRFYNTSNQTGALDHWNLDYVKLDNQATELTINDIALIQAPPNVVAPYSALPYRQLVAAGQGLLNSRLEVGVGTMRAQSFLPATQSNYLIRETNTGQALLQPVFFNNLAAIPAGQPFVTEESLSDLGGALFTNYRNDLLGLPNTGSENYRIATQYNLNSQTSTFTELGLPGFLPFITDNNTATTTTVLADYYAYDDGSAELALEALPQQMVVQRYRVYTPEILRGVSINFPRTSNVNTANLSVRIVVFLDTLVGSAPAFSMNINPVYVEDFYRDSLNGFTSYAFPDSILLPIGNFFIGWQQLGNCVDCVPVGLDRNTLLNQVQYFNNGGNWFELQGCSTGALMLRPLVGNTAVPVTEISEPTAAASGIEVFPNPVQGQAQIRRIDGRPIEQLEWQLFSLAGQAVLGLRNSPSIDLTGLPAGLYVLLCRDTSTGQLSHHKLRVQ
ncbi:MAG: T9SS type A sorting domain-containing protein [Lewinella sp.]|nr:T9SS type A sorting domain-containing protein [Lewinella sp.]